MGSDSGGYPTAKRVLDASIALVLIVVLSPVIAIVLVAMALTMIAKAEDRGSFLYREKRISRGREFDLFKFRTLRRGALRTQTDGEAHARLLESDAANLTWAGQHVLKPWYLDELPQLLNILRGEMSLVGPRPWPPSLVRRQVSEGRDYRMIVAAGWTGPAQVQKGVAEPSDYAELDLSYVARCESWSGLRLAWYDLGILWQTVKLMARGEGLRF